MSTNNPLYIGSFRTIEERPPDRPAPGSQDAADYEAGRHADSPTPASADTKERDRA